MKVLRRRWKAILAVCWWIVLCFMVGIDAINGPWPIEFAVSLAAATIVVATARRYPVVSLATGLLSGFVVLFDFGGRNPIWEGFLLVSAGYFAGRRMERARPALVAFGVISLAGIPASLFLPGAGGLAAWGAAVGLIIFAGMVPWQLGRYVRMRELLARTGWERAEEMESRQQLVADQARLRERARIASDMHDSLGHELSLIAVRAAALEVAGGLDDVQRKAASELRQSAATATDRLRQILGVLREDAAPTEPADQGIGELVERARASGILIEAALDEDADRPSMVAHATYRVVQEALTNVAKHAPGAAVTVRVTRGEQRTDVLVVNEPPPAGPLPGTVSGRRGLIGLGERVRLVGGTLRAEPARGGFEVEASLPHDAAPGDEVPEPEDRRSESARQLDRARRDVRRSLIQAIAVPAGLFGLVVGVSGIVFLAGWYSSELPAANYAQIHVGRTRAEIAAFLPRQQRVARPNREYESPAPSGTRCEYYGTERTVLNLNYMAYRLCFAGGTLVSKDVISEDDGGTRDPGSTG